MASNQPVVTQGTIRIKLKDILERKNMTISQLSQGTGIARSTLTPLVNRPKDVKGIRLETLDTLCEYLNVTLEEIITYERVESVAINKLPHVELTKDGYKITDQWGASLIINHYRHKDTNERRVQILFDNENQGVREWLEENDEGIDIPQELFEVFCLNYQ